VKSAKPPAAPAPAAVSTASSTDVAADADAAKKKTLKKYDFGQTILRPLGGENNTGTRTTLG